MAVINGTSGNNILIGTGSDDSLNGLAGDDLLQGLGGADIINGGAGVDTADYREKAAPIVVTLTGATAAAGMIRPTIPTRQPPSWSRWPGRHL